MFHSKRDPALGKGNVGSKDVRLQPLDSCKCWEGAEKRVGTNMGQWALRALVQYFSAAWPIHPSTRQSIGLTPRPHSQVW